MLKRILAIASGIFLGTVLAIGTARMASVWGLWPGRELERSSGYVREVLQLVNENYVESKSAELPKLTQSALRGILDGLDPHSEYMEARSYKALEEEISNEFGGIGVQVETRNNKVVVIAPIAGTPGERAGIQRGDEIVRIDGAKIEKPSMDEVVDRLRGKPKTKVDVVLYRPSEKKEIALTLVREVIKVESVRDVRMLPGGIGYLQLTQFAERSGEEFNHALADLTGKQMRSLIIDLRNNPGGLLDVAVAVAEPFFKKGELVVFTQGRRADDREEYRAGASANPVKVPVVVLINAGSASAAEIVAGALKDTGRAVIVGERSFGKGSVQSIFRLRNGEGMRLTTARYYTPSGITIHEKGIEPDVDIVMTPEEDRNVRLQRARGDVSDREEFKARFGVEPVPDRQLDAAIAVLMAAELLDERKASSAPLAMATSSAP